jgi:phosphoribosylanthranilate isomerase
MFRVKICGVTTPDDARLAIEAGADAIGLNFYEKSPRSITPQRAAEIALTLPANVERVGVFVDTSAARIKEIVPEARLTAVQLHGVAGDKQLEVVATLDKAVPLVIQAFRLPDPNSESELLLAPVVEFLDGLDVFLRCRLPAVLVDAYRAGQPGGTGIALDWQKLQRERNLAAGVHLVLAGGLTAENVAEAISVARPDAVDVASGVESAPGRKDPAKVRAFVAAAREAFAQLPAGV